MMSDLHLLGAETTTATDNDCPAAVTPGQHPLDLLARKVSWRVQRDILRRETTIARVFDFRMKVPMRVAGIGKVLFLRGEREMDQYRIITSILKPGDIVLDVGSNIGYYPLVEAGLVGESGTVHAFEPDERNVYILEQNIRLNGAGTIIQASASAISDHTGTTTFHIAEETNLNAVERTRGENHESIVSRGMGGRKYVSTVEVPVIDLGDVLARLGRVDLMRMDVEGHEVQILSSLARFAAAGGKGPRAIVFEPHSWEYSAGHDLEPVLAALQGHGYRISALGSRDETCSPIRPFGYEPTETVTDKRGVSRGIYRGIGRADALHLASRVDGVTTVCLELHAA